MKLLAFLTALAFSTALTEAAQPNILWLVNEDHGPHVGAYGDSYATTPTFDGLASEGLRYTHCWSNAPVCAPARTTLICGMYATSTGGLHMRSMVPFPRGKQMYPQLLRQAGYYCTNNAKEDYNVAKPGEVWNESSKKAHWKNRAEGQPFMAVFNFEKSHESQIRKVPHTLVHDPAKAPVPAYHPDTPEVRHDWAQYYDQVTAADADAGARLDELEKAGLLEDTVIFYYADHGSGMPGSKRWPLNRGLQVPLIVYIPEKFAALRPPEYKAGGMSDRLVSFVDFAPTLCSLAGVKPPEWMQGHAFLGEFCAERQPYLYGFRGRMDERVDMVRSVTDGRYVYARNYRPDLIYGQHLAYMWLTPTTPVWKAVFDAGKLNEAQSYFWKTKPPEELYDLQTDPDEVNNLATLPEQSATLTKLRAAQEAHALQIQDVGFLPEGEMHRRSAGASPYDMARTEGKYPLTRILKAAGLASSLDPKAASELIAGCADPDAAVRYWSVLGLLMRAPSGEKVPTDLLAKLSEDPSPDVQIAAAETLLRFGPPDSRPATLALLLKLADWKKNNIFSVLPALAALDAAGDAATPAAAEILALPRQGPSPDIRFKEYPPRLLEDLSARLK